MWNLPPKQLAYIGFYYFFIIFWMACIFYDLLNDAVTGFTFGYVFALLYFIAVCPHCPAQQTNAGIP